MRLPEPAILIVTDRSLCAESLENRAEKLFRGGCRWLSLREKDLPASERLALLRRLMRVGAHFGATVGVHGDVEAAAACGSALHLGREGDPAEARRTLGDDALIGQSCHDRAELDRAGAAAVDYVTLGPAFDSIGKAGYGPAFSFQDFKDLAAASGKPTIALGGIALSTVERLRGASLAGIAVMGEAMQTPEPAVWFQRLDDGWRSIQS